MITIKFLDGRAPLEIEAETTRKAIEKVVANGVNLHYANLSCLDLRGLDLRGSFSHYTDLCCLDLRDTDLRGSFLHYTDLRGSDLSGSDLRNTDLRNAILIDTNLSGSNLRDSNLRDSDLRYTNLRSADLSGSDLRDTDLSGANLDYSCWPLRCGSLKAKIDKRLFIQLLYHTVRAGQSVEDEEVQQFLNMPEVIALANQFHRVGECGKVKNESAN